jgi:pantetheine-phosphate adenylyltransferase
MAKSGMRVAVFPGTFDPITHGHTDVIRRAARLFDRVVVGVGDNPEKSAMFTAAQRARLVRQSLPDLPGIEVTVYRGLTIDFAARCGAAAIVRGIRNGTDLRFESDLAMTNRAASGIETVYILADSAVAYVSSTLVRQIASGGGDVSAMVPAPVRRALRARQRRRRPG